MGRFGTDVVALACIAGGALAGAAVTAGVMVGSVDGADSAASEYRVVTRHCAVVEAPRVVVRLHSEDGESTVTTRSYEAQSGKADAPCVAASTISVVRTTEWREDIGERLDAARAEVEEMRLQAEEMRLHADELRLEAEGFRLESDELRFGDEQEAALKALQELLAGLKAPDAPDAPEAPAAPDAPAAPRASTPAPPAPTAPGSGGN